MRLAVGFLLLLVGGFGDAGGFVWVVWVVLGRWCAVYS